MDVITETVTYPAPDGLPVQTYLARPAGDGPFPGILMCYELWGMLEIAGGGPHMRDVAARFAREGYVAIVPDYYATRGQQPSMQGGTIVGGPPDEEADEDLCAAVRWLQGQPYIQADRIGVIGWCGGGRHALFLAARCPELRAAAAFYGRPVNRPGAGPISPLDLVPQMRSPVFAVFGEDDPAIPTESARALQQALAQHGVPHEFHLYPGAGHAFMNDQRDSYYEPAAADSWRRVLDFFAQHLKGVVPAGA
jgi:carboxymethylenebutenolidase